MSARRAITSAGWIGLFLFLAFSARSQSAADLAALPKDTLVKMAARKIDEPSFDVMDFDRIEVWADENEVMVLFDRTIRFVPRKGQYYYSATVDLISGTKGHSILGEPNPGEIAFYKSLEAHQTKIQFVLDAINNSNGVVEKIPRGQLPNGQMTISDKGFYFEVLVNSKQTESQYKVKKGTGKIYDARHDHLATPWDSTQKRIY